ncbi:hypothetical protein [Sphingomonas profundi]|uniref:hypothetical protein n=1 Tax=Alterirhizorhabdus profundi TaxID=2681549 RepID=UPI0012E6FCDA|nr:hypothetical protein [Sphingomonas profundi]
MAPPAPPPIATLAELDAARAQARGLVHRRALKAAGRAAVPFGFGHDALADLVDDIQRIFRLTPAQRAEIAPRLLTSMTDLIAAYAPPAIGAEAIAGLAARFGANPIARVAGRSFAGRLLRRVAAGRGLLGTVARRAWVIPAALGGGAAAGYELLGRRCINQCHAYLRTRLPGAAIA